MTLCSLHVYVLGLCKSVTLQKKTTTILNGQITAIPYLTKFSYAEVTLQSFHVIFQMKVSQNSF